MLVEIILLSKSLKSIEGAFAPIITRKTISTDIFRIEILKRHNLSNVQKARFDADSC